MNIRPSRDDEHDALLDIWLRSVRATHEFITEADIASMSPMVRDVALMKLQLWTLADEHEQPIGVMGMDGNSIDMLFIDPDHFGRGGGRMLLEHAQSMHEIIRLDVNEQNPRARAFYESQGFVITGRSETDGQGRPFPLLHMQRERSGGNK